MEDAALFTMLLEIRPPWRVTRVEVGERRVRLAFLLFRVGFKGVGSLFWIP